MSIIKRLENWANKELALSICPTVGFYTTRRTKFLVQQAMRNKVIISEMDIICKIVDEIKDGPKETVTEAYMGKLLGMLPFGLSSIKNFITLPAFLLQEYQDPRVRDKSHQELHSLVIKEMDYYRHAVINE